LLRPEEPVYYDQFLFHIRLEDYSIFSEVLSILVRRHPILRTRYFIKSFNQPIKVVMPHIALPVEFVDLTLLLDIQKKESISSYLEGDQKTRLVFDDELLWHLKVFKTGDNEFSVVWSVHHALLDGWSISIFNSEFTRIAKNLKNHGLAPLAYSYKDYCAIQLNRKSSSEVRSFWINLLEGYTRNKLPFNYTGRRVSSRRGMRRTSLEIPTELFIKLNDVAVHHQVSFKSICLSAHAYLMHIVCAEQDVVTGVVCHDRPALDGSENILGCFLNSIPIRVNFSALPDILSLLKYVDRFLNDTKSKEVHLTEIASFIDEKTSFSNPIFDTLLNFTDFHSYESIDKNSILSRVNTLPDENGTFEDSREMTNTLFDIEIDKTLGKFSIKIKYASAYFNDADAKSAINVYLLILEAIAADTKASLSSLNFLTGEELEDLQFNFNSTEAFYRRDVTVNQLFEEQVLKTPDNIALRKNGISVSYNELNILSNRLARHLQSRGIMPGENIGLLAT